MKTNRDMEEVDSKDILEQVEKFNMSFESLTRRTILSINDEDVHVLAKILHDALSLEGVEVDVKVENK